MKFCHQGFAALNHSWSIVIQNISRSLKNLGHSVDIFSTNGIKYFPDDLKENLIGYIEENNQKLNGKYPDKSYDACFSYTALKNFERYLSHSPKNRFGIWCYEFSSNNSLPSGFAKYHKYCDKLLAPSQFARNVFIENRIPEDKVVVVPHGINFSEINAAKPYPLKTTKSIKILMNLGQIHKRKNISGALEMFGKAFNKNDDICLVLKVQDRPAKQMFELNFRDLFEKFERKFPNHAEVEIIRNFIPNIYSLYKACDATFSPSHCEGFGMVPLEGMACGLIPIASNYSGFIDFLNKDNALLIEGKEFNVPPDFLYYESKVGTKAFMPSIDSGVNVLLELVSNFPELKEKCKKNIPTIIHNYNWDFIVKDIFKYII